MMGGYIVALLTLAYRPQVFMLAACMPFAAWYRADAAIKPDRQGSDDSEPTKARSEGLR